MEWNEHNTHHQGRRSVDAIMFEMNDSVRVRLYRLLQQQTYRHFPRSINYFHYCFAQLRYYIACFQFEL